MEVGPCYSNGGDRTDLPGVAKIKATARPWLVRVVKAIYICLRSTTYSESCPPPLELLLYLPPLPVWYLTPVLKS